MIRKIVDYWYVAQYDMPELCINVNKARTEGGWEPLGAPLLLPPEEDHKLPLICQTVVRYENVALIEKVEEPGEPEQPEWLEPGNIIYCDIEKREYEVKVKRKRLSHETFIRTTPEDNH